MKCPHCKVNLVLNGEFEDADVDFVSYSDVSGTVKFTLFCKSCTEELGEYEFEVEQDVSDFTDNHDEEVEHELSVEIINVRFVRSVDHVGFDCVIRLSCSCGEGTDFEYEDSIREIEVTNELIND
jgi:hypothetical protein